MNTKKIYFQTPLLIVEDDRIIEALGLKNIYEAVQKIDPLTNQPMFDAVTGEPIYELKEPITAGNISVNSNLLTDDGIWNIACAFFENEENVAEYRDKLF